MRKIGEAKHFIIFYILVQLLLLDSYRNVLAIIKPHWKQEKQQQKLYLGLSKSSPPPQAANKSIQQGTSNLDRARNMLSCFTMVTQQLH